MLHSLLVLVAGHGVLATLMHFIAGSFQLCHLPGAALQADFTTCWSAFLEARMGGDEVYLSNIYLIFL